MIWNQLGMTMALHNEKNKICSPAGHRSRLLSVIAAITATTIAAATTAATICAHLQTIEVHVIHHRHRPQVPECEYFVCYIIKKACVYVNCLFCSLYIDNCGVSLA